MCRAVGFRCLVAAACGLAAGGCGEAEMEGGIARSPYAPTQAQLDELNKQVVGQYKSAGRHASKRHPRAGHHG